MACPFFYPLTKANTGTWAVPPRLPLGDPHDGECRCSGAVFQPSTDHVTKTCNVGYARGVCERFPRTHDIDAVRFHIAADHGSILHVQFVLEKNCWPVQHGELTVTLAPESAAEIAPDILSRQAQAFAASYARRR